MRKKCSPIDSFKVSITFTNNKTNFHVFIRTEAENRRCYWLIRCATTRFSWNVVFWAIDTIMEKFDRFKKFLRRRIRNYNN